MVLCIDIGSSLIKGGLIGTEGQLIALSRAEARFDTANWLAGIEKICKELSETGKKPLAIAVSGNGPTLVALDKEGTPLGSPLSWLDKSPEKHLGEIKARIGGKVDARYYLSKVYNFKEERPDLFKATHMFLPCPEWVNYYLTGNSRVILHAPRAEKYFWDEDSLKSLGLDNGKFPPFITPGSIVGKLRESAASRLGLQAGLPVITCGIDFLMSLLGTASIHPGSICDRAGTSEGINLCTATELNDKRLLVMPHIIDSYYNASGLLTTSGLAYWWIKRNTGLDAVHPETLLSDLVKIEPSTNNPVFLPFLQPGKSSLWDYSVGGTFSGLTLDHTGKHMVKAVLEATGFAARDILDIFSRHLKDEGEITVTGGATAFPAWNQLRADITGRNIRQPEITDSELTGCACLACKALGIFSTTEDAVKGLVKIRREYTPRQEYKSIYNELYTKYRHTYTKMTAKK